MKYMQILITTLMLTAGTLGTRAITVTEQCLNNGAVFSGGIFSGNNFVTCQVATTVNGTIGFGISDPAFLTVPSNWSDPNGVNNAVFLHFTSGFNLYQYFTGADADNYFALSGSSDGWYDGAGTLGNPIWNPGQGHIIYLPPGCPSGNISLTGNQPAPTSFVPLSGYTLRGCPLSTIASPSPANVVGSPQNGDLFYVYKGVGTLDPSLAPQNFFNFYYDSFQGGWVPNSQTINPNYRSGWVRRGGFASAVIEGNVFMGANCSSTTALQNWTIRAVSGGNSYYGISGVNGHYAIVVPPGTYTVSSYLPPVGWVELCGGSTFPCTAGNFYLGRDFYEQAPTGAGKDLAVDLVSFFPYPLRSPCCGQNMTYVVSARNSGGVALSPTTARLTFPTDQIPTIPLATSLPAVANFTVVAAQSYPTIPGQVTWKRTTAMGAGGSRNFKCTVTLPSSPCSGPITAQARFVFPS